MKQNKLFIIISILCLAIIMSAGVLSAAAMPTVQENSEGSTAETETEEVPEEEAQEIWTDSFKAMLLRYHCARVPLSWELFEDGRSILRYATAYDDIFASGFDQ